MRRQRDFVWVILQKHGIVQGSEPSKTMDRNPWYLKLLLAFSGWLSSIFVSGYIVFLTQFEFIGLGISGFVLVVCAFLLLRKVTNDFVEHLGLAMSMSGQASISFSLSSYTGDSYLSSWGVILLMQILLVLIMPSFVHRVISAMLGAAALFVVLTIIGLPSIALTIILLGLSFCWLKEFDYPQKINEIRAVGYGFALYFAMWNGIFFDVFYSFIYFPSEVYIESVFWIYAQQAVLAIAVFYVIWMMLKRFELSVAWRTGITILSLVLCVAMSYVGLANVVIGLIIMCLGFYAVNRILIGLGVITSLYAISAYYYFLNTTLFDKSISLFAIGIILLFIRWGLKRLVHLSDEVCNVSHP